MQPARYCIDLSRTEALLGGDAVARLAASHVAVVGVGGVGGWCAEALVRTGVGRLTLVDDDVVAPSNANRQCPATWDAMGRKKVEAMRDRLLAVNPNCSVEARCARFPSGPAASEWALSEFDCIVDAIDSVDCKAALLLAADEAGVPFVSSMGAALRFDPTKVAVRPFRKVEGDGLARALRQRFRKLGRFPAADFPCVCSMEASSAALQAGVKGSLMQVTCTFGMALAAQAVAICAGPVSGGGAAAGASARKP